MSKLIQTSGKLFKHDHTFTGYAEGVPYLNYKSGKPYVDGIQRGHVRLYGRCDICDQEFLVAMIHTDATGKLYQTKLDKT